MTTNHNSITKIAISLRPLASFAWRMLLSLTLCRVVFVAWQWQQVVDAHRLGSILALGFRFDLVLLGLTLTIPALAFPILASNRYLLPAWRGLLKVCLPAVLLIIVFTECSTPSFVDQFDSRPNMLFFEYLNAPWEVGAALWAAYKLPIVVAILVVSTMTWINAQQIKRMVRQIQPIGVIPAIVVTPFLLIACFSMILLTLDYPPTDPDTVASSKNPRVNELASYTARPQIR